MTDYILVIAFYALFLIGVGLFISRKVKTVADFFVGGRKIGYALLFITMLAPNIGGGSTVGVAGLGYAKGLSAIWWIAASAAGTIIMALVIGPKIWAIAKEHNFYTLGDYFEYRYNKNFRGLISLLMFIGTIAIFAGQLMGIAWILSVIGGIDKILGVIIAAIVLMLYFCTGGLLSAAYVNIIEVFVKLAGFIIAVPLVLNFVGGWQGLAFKAAKHLSDITAVSSYFSLDGMGTGAVIGFFLMLTPSFFLSPALIGKVYSAKSRNTIRVSVCLCGVVMFFFAAIPVILGMAAYAMQPDLAQRDLALPYIMTQGMPFWASAVALAAIFSAEVSAADAVLYMITTSFSQDIYKSFLNPAVSDAELLRVSRMVTIAAGIIGIFLAVVLPDVISALSIFYSLMSVSLTAPLLFGLFSKRASASSAFWAAGSGVALTVILEFFNGGKGFSIFNAQSTAIVFSILVMFLCIIITPRKKRAGE